MALLVLSPCKVRNFIQAQLGVPQTEVLNKSQTTREQANCRVYEAIPKQIVNAGSFDKYVPFAATGFADLYFSDAGYVHSDKPLKPAIARKTIRLYLMHGNLKIPLQTADFL